MAYFRPTKFPTPDDGDFGRAVYSYMVSAALAHLLQQVTDKRPLPSADDLAGHVEELARKHGAPYLHDEREGPKGRLLLVSLSKLTTDAARAAQFALANFRPDFKLKAADRGRKSKRPPTYYVKDLYRADTVGLPAREQARLLGCSLSTVRRLRARDRALSTAPTGPTGDPEMDALLAESD